jgi:hypothetical protein
LRYNDAIIKGFDFYDIEICLRALGKYKLVIDHRIVVEHFGTGKYISKRWISDALNFYDHKSVKSFASLVSAPGSKFLEDFAFKRFVERVAAINDFGWRLKVLAKLFFRFPLLLFRNTNFYGTVRKRFRNTK